MTGLSVRGPLRSALQFDRDGLDVAAGVRAGICLVVPVVIGVGTGHTLDGLIASLGSLNVAMAEGVGSYSSRAATLGSVLVGNALSIAAGTLTALAGWWGVPILMAWVFVAAYTGVIAPVAERTGWFAALMFMIGIGFGDPSVANAGRYAGLAAVGGMWAIVVISVFWPFHPHRPFVRAWGRSIAAVADLLKLVAQSASDGELDRAVARAESLGHAAQAVTHWHAVRPSRSPPMPDQLRRLARAGEQARTYAMILVDGLRRRAELRDAAADTRRLAGVLGEGLAAVSGDLDKNGQPRQSSAAHARRVSESVAGRLAPGHEHERELSALRRVLANFGGEPDEAIAIDAPPARPQSSRGARGAASEPEPVLALVPLRAAVFCCRWCRTRGGSLPGTRQGVLGVDHHCRCRQAAAVALDHVDRSPSRRNATGGTARHSPDHRAAQRVGSHRRPVRTGGHRDQPSPGQLRARGRVHHPYGPRAAERGGPR